MKNRPRKGKLNCSVENERLFTVFLRKSSWNSALVICINPGQDVTLVFNTHCTLSAHNVYVCFASNNPVITPLWLSKTTTHTHTHTHTHQASVLSISLTYGSVWKVSRAKFYPLKQLDDWNVCLCGIASEGFSSRFHISLLLILTLIQRTFCQCE